MSHGETLRLSEDPYAAVARDMMTNLLDTTERLAWPLGSAYRALRADREDWIDQAPVILSQNEVHDAAGWVLTSGEQQLMQEGLDWSDLRPQISARVTAGRVAKQVLCQTLGITTDGDFNHKRILREPGSVHTIPLCLTVSEWSDSYAGRFMLAGRLGLTRPIVMALRKVGVAPKVESTGDTEETSDSPETIE